MANKIRYPYPSGATLDAYVFRNRSDGYVWYPSGATWEQWGSGSRAAVDYVAETLEEQGTGSQNYTGDFPTGITTAGYYDVQLRLRSGANAADSDPTIGLVEIYWTGSALIEVSDATADEDATDLVNFALAKLGGGRDDSSNTWTIDSINGDTPDEELALLLYNRVRREVLLDLQPQCAVKYAECTTENAAVGKAAWTYAFDLPTDYLGHALQIWEQVHASTRARHITGIDKEIVQGAILTNVLSNEDGDGVYIRYTFNQTDVSEFSDWVWQCIAIKLAAEMCPVMLSDKGERRIQLLQEYEQFTKPWALNKEAQQQGSTEDFGGFATITARVP